MASSKPTVAILGTGPAAAFCHRACMDNGIAPEVYGERDHLEDPHGYFWLHGLPASSGAMASYALDTIYVIPVGELREYYGMQLWSDPTADTSVPDRAKVVNGYNWYDVKDWLWEGHRDIREVRFYDMAHIREETKGFDLVFVTFSPPELARRQPPARKIWVTEEPCDRKARTNWCLYNCTGWGTWLRTWQLFGARGTEWAEDPGGRAIVQRKLDPRCATVQEQGKYVFVGRFAQWERKFLCHQAYDRAVSFLQQYGVSS